MYPIPMSEAFLISDLLPKLWLQIQIPLGLECRKFPLWFMGKLLLIFILLDKMICSDSFLWGLHRGVLGHVHNVMGNERCSALVWYPCSDCVLPWEFVLARWKCVQGWGEEFFFCFPGVGKTHLTRCYSCKS